MAMRVADNLGRGDASVAGLSHEQGRDHDHEALDLITTG